MGENLCPRFRKSGYFINKWLKTRNPEYKIRVVSKKEFAIIKIQAEKKEQ